MFSVIVGDRGRIKDEATVTLKIDMLVISIAVISIECEELNLT